MMDARDHCVIRWFTDFNHFSPCSGPNIHFNSELENFRLGWRCGYGKTTILRLLAGNVALGTRLKPIKGTQLSEQVIAAWKYSA